MIPPAVSTIPAVDRSAPEMPSAVRAASAYCRRERSCRKRMAFAAALMDKLLPKWGLCPRGRRRGTNLGARAERERGCKILGEGEGMTSQPQTELDWLVLNRWSEAA